MRKLFVAPVIVVGVVALSGTAAFAHECFNASRSAKGNEGAARSQAWLTLTLAEIYEDVILHPDEEHPLPPADLDDVDAMLADAEARGLPSSFTIHLPSTAASGVQGTAHSSDRKGIDHFFTGYGGDLIDAYLCGATGEGCITG